MTLYIRYVLKTLAVLNCSIKSSIVSIIFLNKRAIITPERKCLCAFATCYIVGNSSHGHKVSESDCNKRRPPTPIVINEYRHNLHF